MKTIGITGGTGFVGRHLASLLVDSGNEVIIFTRSPAKHTPEHNITYAYWEPGSNKCDKEALDKLDAAVHLAGAGIADKRWTEARKKEIVNSRVEGTRFFVSALKEYAPRCKTLVAASAIGYYGADAGDNKFTETDKPADDFLGHTCQKWEHESLVADSFLRTVILRFGIVLGKEAGAYAELAKPMKFAVMPILGSGQQVVSWVQVDDLAAIIAAGINDNTMHGIYNAVAPHPVSHKVLMKTIATQKGGIKIPVPVPAVLLKAVLGEMSIEVLKSCTVSAQKLLNAGFTFHYPNINAAVDAIEHKHSR